MNPQWRKFAPFGLYLALLAAVVGAGFYIFQNSFTLPVQISLAVLVIGLAAFVALDPDNIRKTLTGRQARYGSNAFILLLAVLGILIVINYLAYKNTPRWDLTQDKSHTLAPETLALLKKLPGPVKAVAFFTQRTSSVTARNLLDSYKANSNGKFDFQFIDPDSNPSAATAAGISRDGTIVFTEGKQSEQVTAADESTFTTTLIKLTNPGKHVIYFLTGDGEFDINGTSDQKNSYSQLNSLLGKKNYTINTLNLISKQAVPDDALAVVIAGPQKFLTDQEVKILKAYVDKGHSLVVFSETPILNSALIPDADPLAKYLDTEWGIKLDNDLIVDRTVNPPSFAAANGYGNHAITQKMNGVASIFPTSRSLTLTTAPTGVTVTSLAQTADVAWGETDVKSIQDNQVSEGPQDIKGPLNLAAAAENSTTKGRVVVVGDADFTSDTFYSSYGNSDFAVNSIDWAAQQDTLINITPKTPVSRFLLPPQGYVMTLLFLGLVIFLPGIVIVGGIYTWIVRRRRG